MPCMKFLFVRSDVCRQLPSDFTLRWTPLLLAIQFPLLGLARDYHPLDNAHAERTKKNSAGFSRIRLSSMWAIAQHTNIIQSTFIHLIIRNIYSIHLILTWRIEANLIPTILFVEKRWLKTIPDICLSFHTSKCLFILTEWTLSHKQHCLVCKLRKNISYWQIFYCFYYAFKQNDML